MLKIHCTFGLIIQFFLYGVKRYIDCLDTGSMFGTWHKCGITSLFFLEFLLNGLINNNLNNNYLFFRYLEFLWDKNKIREQDFFTVFSNIRNTDVGLGIAWDWARANYQRLRDR